MENPGLLALFASAFATGFIVAVPPGAVTVRAAQLALGYNFRHCLFFTLGSALSDVFYLVLTWLGVAHVLGQYPTVTAAFFIASAALLAYLAWGSLAKASPHLAEGNGETTSLPALKLVLSGAVITLLNPLTVGGWLAVGGTFFLRAKAQWPGVPFLGTFAVFAIMCGALTWFIPLLYAIHRMKARVHERAIAALVKVSGLCLAGFAVAALWSGAKILAGL